jgi:hypothetical protein
MVVSSCAANAFRSFPDSDLINFKTTYFVAMCK